MEKRNTTSNTKSIALGGILTAFSVICLFLATVLPTSRLSFYALSSFSAAIIVMEFGGAKGFIFYAATALLSLIIIPNKMAVAPFIVFFGLFGVIKFYIEKMRNIFFEYIIKLAYFNLCLFMEMFILKEFLLSDNSKLLELPLWVMILVFQLIFLVYDYVYTLFIQYYQTKLKKILRI